MNNIIHEVLQHLDSSLSVEFDYNNVNQSLDFLFHKSFNGKKMSVLYSYDIIVGSEVFSFRLVEK